MTENQSIIAIHAPGATLKTVAAALVADHTPPPVVVTPKPSVQIKMTDKLVRALTVLPAVFAKVQPETARALSLTEVKELDEEYAAIQEIAKALTARSNAIKNTMRIHMASVAVAHGDANSRTDIDAKGFPVVASQGAPQQLPVPETTHAWSLEYREAEVTVNDGQLVRMLNDGEITRAQYLALTKDVRVFDEDKAFASIVKDNSLLSVLRKITRKGTPSTALFIRDLK